MKYLFDRYVRQVCSDNEERELMELIARPSHAATVRGLITELITDTGEEREIPADKAAAILQHVLNADGNKTAVLPALEPESIAALRALHAQYDPPSSTPETDKAAALPPLRKMRVKLRAIAAAAVVILFAGLAFWLTEMKTDPTATARAKPEQSAPALPGGDHAFLTLADGSVIQLDSLQNGLLPTPGVKAVKQDGLLIYHASSTAAGTPAFNTLSTPRGGQFSIVLPDGSRVWLNASSTLNYPTVFADDRREVTLNGEAYFEVATQPGKPFIVTVADMQVEVLGTHFNINAYEDESSIRTSLLEGSVKLSGANKVDLLRPGQQGSFSREKATLEIKEASMDQAVAWKNGLFQFEKAGIREIMRQISRWYNVEVSYVGQPTDRMFDGKIRRSAELSKVLRILELSGVKFSVEGNHVTVH